jgi:hypothetical protein
MYSFESDNDDDIDYFTIGSYYCCNCGSIIKNDKHNVKKHTNSNIHQSYIKGLHPENLNDNDKKNAIKRYDRRIKYIKDNIKCREETIKHSCESDDIDDVYINIVQGHIDDDYEELNRLENEKKRIVDVYLW